MKIFTSDRAQGDLLRIHGYLADRNPRAAEDFIEEVDARFKNLALFPFIGRERSSLAPGLRSVLVGTHLILYVVENDRIFIVRVIDGRMDIDEEFRR